MSRHALSALAFLALVSSAAAQSGTDTASAATPTVTPLVDHHYIYPNLVSKTFMDSSLLNFILIKHHLKFD